MMLKPTKRKSIDSFELYLQDIGHLKQRLSKKEQGSRKAIDDPQPSERLAQNKQQLIEGHLALVISIAKHYQHRSLALLDLIQEGNIGLMQAVDRFDAQRGIRFTTYASYYIRGYIQEAIKGKGSLIKMPRPLIDTLQKIEKARQCIGKTEEPTLLKLGKALEIVPTKLHALLNSPHASLSIEALNDQSWWLKESRIPSPLQALMTEERDRLLAKALKGLDPRERKMIRMRFGISKENAHTLEQIGTYFELSRERVRQIEKGALGTLKKTLYRAGYGP